METDETGTSPIIKSRFRLMGEGAIPQSELEGIDEAHLKIFLSEPDPDQWPAEIAHLRQYIQDDSVA